MIWLVFALLSVVGLLFMGLPLRHRSSRTPVPADATDAVLMDQLDEVRRILSAVSFPTPRPRRRSRRSRDGSSCSRAGPFCQMGNRRQGAA